MHPIEWLDSANWFTAAAAVPVALLIDRWLGEPPARLHPVVWIGHYLARAGSCFAPLANHSSDRADWTRFWSGAGFWWFGAAMVFALAAGLQQWTSSLHPVAGLLVLGLVLKPLLAWRMLRGEVLRVEAAMHAGVADGRLQLARLVSRDVSGLCESEIRESAIESLAENLNDSLVAPLFWFALLGLPGAALYRFANTADAMWGYPGVYAGRYWAWAGKWAARADDVLSWAPARLTALLLAALTAKGTRRPVLRRLGQEAGQTPSPNSGWPMAAMALSLNVRLSKPGVYVLNGAGRAPQPRDTTRAVALAHKAVIAWGACVFAMMLSIGLVMQAVR